MEFDAMILDPIINAAKPVLDLAPRLLAFVAVVIVGLVLAYLLRKLIVFVLRISNFDVLSYRIGLTSLVSKAWYDQSAKDLIGRLVYWVVLLFHLFLAVSVLHVEALNQMVSGVIGTVPQLLVSTVIFVFGYFVSRFLGRAALIGLVNSQYKSASLIAFLLRGIIMIFFFAVAAEYLGVGRGIVISTFAILLGGVVLALAIAFGFGGREIARDLLEKKLRSLEHRSKGPDDLYHI